MRYASHCQGLNSRFYELEIILIIEINDVTTPDYFESAEPLAAYTNTHTHPMPMLLFILMFNSRDLLAIYVFRNTSL